MKYDSLSLRVLLIALSASCGCASNSRFLDGICRTSVANDTFDELFWESIRRFPADHDERQCAVFGTNGWLRVESYPDGTPRRVVSGDVKLNGGPDNITTSAIEYDFYGNVISRYSLYDLMERTSVTQPDFAKSRYWRNYRRVVRAESHLALDYYHAVYYYQESTSCLKVGIWAIDRGRHSMDKMVLDVRLVDGCAVSDVKICSHIGSLVDFKNASVDGDGRIRLQFQMKVNGKAVDVDGFIDPA